MGANTTIEWTTHTFNPWRGCTKVAAGCQNCYAETLSKRNPSTLGIWGPNGTRVLASEAMWRQPVKWNREAACCCRKGPLDHEHEPGCPQRDRPRVFCASLADVFEDWDAGMLDAKGRMLVANDLGDSLYTLNDARTRLFRLIDDTPNLDWLLLTKRPENVRRMWPIDVRDTSGPESREYAGRSMSVGYHKRNNVWLGTSIATQEDADKNIPELLKCRDLAAKLFVSVEPLVGPVDFRQRCFAENCQGECGWPSKFDLLADNAGGIRALIDWVIVGGESGPNARPCNVDWIRSIAKQCAAAGVPCFVKQLGGHVIGSENERHEMCGICIDKRPGTDEIVRWKVRDNKGGDPSEWPEDLRVREFPSA